MRTIIQLREEQHVRLRELAQVRGTSIAALVREGVDEVLGEQERRRRERSNAIDELTGLGATGPPDLARDHDRHLADLET